MFIDQLRLTTRLLLFFLGSLAVVLLGFDAGLYVIVRGHLDRQLNARLDGALGTLAAAVEIDDEGLEWEPHDRTIVLGNDASPDRICWTVRDESGRDIDRSEGADWLAAGNIGSRPAQSTDGAHEEVEWQGERWRFARRTLTGHSLPGSGSELSANATSSNSPAGKESRFAALIITTALPLTPLHTSLRNLIGVLVALSFGVWLICAVSGKGLCRRALSPLLDMAGNTEHISTELLSTRLPVRETGDELEVLGRSFNELLARFEEAFERQKRFTADASHQFRTPLAVMLGQIDVALRKERPAEEYQRVLQLLRRRVLELQQTTELLLLLARADKDAQIIETATVDLRNLLPEIASRRVEASPGSEVQLNLPVETPLCVNVHRELFTQVIDNLLDNAARYGSVGKPIELHAQQQNGRILVAVEDHGPGISPEDLPHLFDPFYRGSAGRANGHAGAGLGLSVAKRLMEAQNGTINVESSPRDGSRFVIRLPSAFAQEVK